MQILTLGANRFETHNAALIDCRGINVIVPIMSPDKADIQDFATTVNYAALLSLKIMSSRKYVKITIKSLRDIDSRQWVRGLSFILETRPANWGLISLDFQIGADQR